MPKTRLTYPAYQKYLPPCVARYWRALPPQAGDICALNQCRQGADFPANYVIFGYNSVLKLGPISHGKAYFRSVLRSISRRYSVGRALGMVTESFMLNKSHDAPFPSGGAQSVARFRDSYIPPPTWGGKERRGPKGWGDFPGNTPTRKMLRTRTRRSTPRQIA